MGNKNRILKGHTQFLVYCSIIHNSEDNRNNLSAHEQMSRLKNALYIYTMEYNSAIRKKAILPFVSIVMDLLLGKISQTEKDKYCMLSLICGI